MATTSDHDSYIAAAPESFRAVLDHVRDLLSRALPEAEEMTAYDMPGFSVGGKVVASYAAFSKQVGLYVLAPPSQIMPARSGQRASGRARPASRSRRTSRSRMSS